MEHGVPLTIGDVAFTPWQIARMRAVKERDFEPLGLEQVMDGNPINASRFPGDGARLMLLEPGAQGP